MTPTQPNDPSWFGAALFASRSLSQRSFSRSFALFMATGIALFGCVPAFPEGAAREANATVPDSYGATSGSETAESTALVDWHAFFVDPHLTALIEGALENNQELNISVQETLVAKYEIIARRGALYPSVDVGVGAGIEHVGETTSQGRSDEMAGLPANLQDYGFGLRASWEIDVWRRLRNLRDSATNRYLATLEGRNFMVTQLVAEIAQLYYELVSLDRKAQVIDSNIELQESSLEMARAQQQAGAVTMLAVTRFEGLLRGFQSRRYEIRQEIVEAENQINFLVGRFPQPVARTDGDFLEMEPPLVSAGLPTSLLENRPDVRRAELLLEASQLDVRAARARFYPSLTLEAGIGYQASEITSLVNTPTSMLYSIFANIMAPLFNRSEIKAEYFVSNARQMQAVLSYERSILNAFTEVSSRLSLIENLASSYALKEQQVERLTESIEMSTLLFNSARADYLEVLLTRRDALEAQMELIETRRNQMSAAISLYQALGGGWSQPQRANEDDAQVEQPEAPVEAQP